jgi:NDP-sugar pyrophosphorylase family protein
VEAIILAGGRAERLGDAAGGRPKSLVDVAGLPLAAYQVGRLARAGVTRVIFACASGEGSLFEQELAGLGPEIVDVFALNGDELVDVDYAGLLARHQSRTALATIAVARPKSQFGLVDIGDDDVVRGFEEAGKVPYWVNCGNYVLSEEALARFPERGDHESTTFPELVAEGRLHAFRHEGLWLTVNTPKELRSAAEHVAAHPEWLA